MLYERLDELSDALVEVGIADKEVVLPGTAGWIVGHATFLVVTALLLLQVG
jgi:hypothetical protein